MSVNKKCTDMQQGGQLLAALILTRHWLLPKLLLLLFVFPP